MSSASRMYFGWCVVAGAVICILFGYSSFVSVVFGLFTTSLEAEFGWTRLQTSFAGTLATGSIVILAPVVGLLVDRFGARCVMLPSLALFGGAVIGLSQLNGSIMQYYFLVVLLATVAMGTQPPVFSRMVVGWFDRQRGLALGITLSGVGLAGMVLPSFLQPLIAERGWRTAYLAYGLVVLLVVFPIALYSMRNAPLSVGLAPNGGGAETASRMASDGLDVRAALGDRAMWKMLAAFALMGLVSAGFFIHIAPMMKERGYGMGAIAMMLALKGGFVIVGRVLSGVLVDRYFAPYVSAVLIGLTAVGLALVATGDSLAMTATGVVLMGIGLGAEFDLMAYLISRYIGFRAYGRIYGVTYAAFGFGGAIGPAAMGIAAQQFGSYVPGLSVMAAAPLIAAALLGSLGPYRFGSHAHEASSVPTGAASQKPVGETT